MNASEVEREEDLERRLDEAEALRESDAKFRNLADNITDAFWIRSADMSEVHYLSPAFERIWGRSIESFVADPNLWVDCIAPEDRERVVNAILPMTGDARSVDVEYRIVRPDGEMRWVQSRGFQVRDGADRVTRIAGIVTDVTERRHAEIALQKSLDEFRTLAESMPQIVWVTRPDGWNVYFNQQWMQYTGLSEEESRGDGWITPFHPQDRGGAAEAWRRATLEVGIYALECRLRRFDGIYRWWLIRGVPVRGESGSVTKWFGTCTDIHDLKLAQLEITRTNRALKMLSSCGEVLIRAEEETQLLESVCRIAVESGGYRMAWVGYAQDDGPKSILPIAQAGDTGGYLTEITVTWDAALPSGQGPAGEVIRTGAAVVCADFIVDCSFVPWQAAARRHGLAGVVCLPLRDATRVFGVLALYTSEVVESSAEELRLLQQVADDVVFGIGNLRLAAERRALRAQLMVSDRMASVGTLAAGMAHEINNPLAAVIANLDYIGEILGEAVASGTDVPGLVGELREPLADAREAAQRVRFIVRDLKLFSRSPSDESTASVDVRDVLESSLRMGWNEVRHRAQVVKSYEPVPPVQGNEARLGQVFLNLIVNAGQALPVGRADQNHIRLSTRLEGQRVIVEVADTGPGIPLDSIGRVFDAFYTTKPVGSGTGLGLAISHRIVTDMGGELTVASEVGRGTTFRVALPVRPLADPEDHAPTPALAPGQGEMILVVDDDVMIGRVAKRTLERFGYSTLVASGGSEAVALFSEHRRQVALVITDMIMPEMNGEATIAALRALEPDVRVIRSSGNLNESGRSVEEGFLAKPYTAATLLTAVQLALAGA